MDKIKIGLLEFGTGTATNMLEVVDNIVNYAVCADELGFSKFWLGEHYLVNNVAWYTPEAFIPIIAGMTENISVGPAGVLLSYHNPYRVALQYKMLSNLYPGRIDLGLANGGVPEVVRDLYLPGFNKFPHEIPDYFNTKLTDLANMLNNEESMIKSGLSLVPPYKGNIPELWYLGVRYQGLKIALSLKMNFSKSIFHTPDIDIFREKEKLIEFREEFYNVHNVYPKINIAFAGLCHKTIKTAQKIRTGLIEANNTASFNEVIGCPNYFFDLLSKFSEQYQVDEFIFFNKALVYEDRMLSLELLSNKFSLKKTT